MKDKCMACGFSAEESEQIESLPNGIGLKLLAIVEKYGLPAAKAALPYLLVGDWVGAIEAALKTVVPAVS